MFKNAVIYKFDRELALSAQDFLAGLEAARFVPCGATQKKSSGWVAPRGLEHGALIEVVAGHYFLRLTIESKSVPPQVLRRKLEEKVKLVEDQTGRKPGKRERKELAEQVELEMLPNAFSKRQQVNVWVAPGEKYIVLDTSSATCADEVVTQLVKCVEGLQIRLLDTAVSPSVAMTNWLLDGHSTPQFSIDRDCELKSMDEMKSVVRYGRHLLDSDEVKAHLKAGKKPIMLGMTWGSRISFVLTERGFLKRLSFLDVVFEKANQNDEVFDADAVILGSEMLGLIRDLVAALGGENTCPGRDPLYDKAVAIVRDNASPSISLLQQHLQIGYNRSARLLEEMEKEGVVSALPPDGGPRTLIDS